MRAPDSINRMLRSLVWIPAVLIVLAIAGVAGAAIPEAGICLYGRVTGASQQLLTSGQLTWIFAPPAAPPVSVTVSLAAIPGPNSETFSYVLYIPAESIVPGDTLSQGAVGYPVNPLRYTRAAWLNGQPLYFNSAGEESSHEYAVDDHRGGAFRIDLGLSDCLLPSAPTGLTASDDTLTDRTALGWNAVEGADSYEIRRNTLNDSGAATWVATVSTPPYEDLDIVPGIAYFYWVRAHNSCGWGPFSEVDAGRAGGVIPEVQALVNGILGRSPTTPEMDVNDDGVTDVSDIAKFFTP